MKSCIFKGLVSHRRFQPRSNSFSYQLFMLYLDLDELDTVFDRYWFWSSKRFSPAWFRRKDHLFDSNIDIRDEIKNIVKSKTGKNPEGPIRLLTHLRYFGYCFNPISLYYCFDRQDSKIEYIVAEVHNTPWNERHCYVLANNQNDGNQKKMCFKKDKTFHVSPFMDKNMVYEWTLTEPNELLLVNIKNMRGSNKLFDATLNLKRAPINSFELASVLIGFPFMTVKIIALIYYQALKIWLKKIPYVPHSSADTQI